MNLFRKRLEEADHTKIAVMGLPYDEGSSFLRGPAKAPDFIRSAFHSSSSDRWTELGVNLAQGVFSDLGDLEIGETGEPLTEIEQAASLILEKAMVPVFLGGDHIVTYPIIKAFAKRYDKLNILHFDAHPDLYDELDGNRYSHACPFARIMEEKLAANLTQIGIRVVNGHQREQARRFGVRMIEMREFDRSFIPSLNSPLYISFDLDALDPAFAPGVSHHEPGGLSTREAIHIIQSLDAEIVGADIVELNPDRDPLGITAMVGAKLLKEIMGRVRSQS